MEKISIIIPVLNEADHLPGLLRSIFDNQVTSAVGDIIVVDGGSTDGSQRIARQMGVRVLQSPQAKPGRASQLNAGAAVAVGTILFFVDADSKVPRAYDEDILTTLRLPRCVGGAFEFKLEGAQFGLRIVECINRIRYRIWPWYYGDQGIFVSRQAFDAVGGFPLVSLMEASDFCRAITKTNDLWLVHKDMRTSARRFVENGIYRVLGFDVRMWWKNLIGQDVESFARDYWQSE